jgi:hypothetical protein
MAARTGELLVTTTAMAPIFTALSTNPAQLLATASALAPKQATPGSRAAELLVAGAGAADTSAPVLNSAFSPAAGTITRAQSIVIPLRDADSPISSTTVWAVFGDGLEEVVYRDGAFGASYSAGSSSSGTPSSTPGTLSLTVARTGGWRWSSFTLRVDAIDNAGNLGTFSSAYTVSNPPAAPTLSPAPSPAPGTIVQTQTIVLSVSSDSATDVASLVLWAEFPSGLKEVIWADGAFASGYSGSSFSGTVGSSSTVAATLIRTGMWNQASLVLHADATDGQGRSAALTASYTISNPSFLPPDATPPTIANMLPAPGTAIARTDPILFDVTDNQNLKRCLVLVYFTDGTYEVIHDGDNFAQGYAALSSRLAITGGFRYRVRRTAGWLSTPTVKIVAYDASGNED